MPSETEFERQSRAQRASLAKELLLFMLENKLWWMLPIVLVMGLVGLLAFFAGTGAAPFIYTVF